MKAKAKAALAYLWAHKAQVLLAVGYVRQHRKQLAAAVAFGAGLLDAIQRAH